MQRPPHSTPMRLWLSARRPVLPWLVLTGLVAVATVAPHQASADLQQAPNSRVVLDLPAGYQPAPLFSGFQNDPLGVSLVIMEAPAKAYDEIASGFNAAGLATRGITDVVAGTLTREGRHVYMRARQPSPAGNFAKFFVLFPTADQTVLVTANVPEQALQSGAVKIADIEAILASARTVDATAVRDLYRLGYLGPFKEAGRLVGTSKVYTLDGKLEPARRSEPRAAFLVAPSLDKRPILEPERTAAHLLSTLSGYRDLQFGTPSRLTVDGLDGILIEGSATDVESNQPMRLLQVMLLGRGGGYFRLLGLTPPDTAAELMPQMRRMAESFKLSDDVSPSPR